jgi:hypothetical protein
LAEKPPSTSSGVNSSSSVDIHHFSFSTSYV